MNKDKTFTIVAVLLVVLAFGGLILYKKSGPVDPASPAAGGYNEPTTVTQKDILIRAHNFTKGPATAKVTVVEFLDPECSACRSMHPIVKQLQGEYGDKVRFVTRYMLFHPHSVYAASVLQEVLPTGKYEQAIDILMDHQPEWGLDAYKDDSIPNLLAPLGFKKEQLAYDKVVPKHQPEISADENDGKVLGVDSTPTFIVNDQMLHEIGLEPLKKAIDQALAK